MKQKLLKILRSSYTAVTVIVVISVWMAVSYFGVSAGKELLFPGDSDTGGVTSYTQENADDCSVSGINLHGEIVTYHSPESYDEQGKLIADETSSDDVYWILKSAEADDRIKAVLVEIDSSGGASAAGEEIMLALKHSKKPVTALIRRRGLSAAYMAATGASTIYASEMSDIGSIGTTMSYMEDAGKNRKDGLNFIDLSSGIYKESGNPDRPITVIEKRMFMRDVMLIHDIFVQAVVQNRQLDINKVRKLADGSSMLAVAALENGLIDKIGGIYEVESFLEEQIGEAAQICWQN